METVSHPQETKKRLPGRGGDGSCAVDKNELGALAGKLNHVSAKINKATKAASTTIPLNTAADKKSRAQRQQNNVRRRTGGSSKSNKVKGSVATSKQKSSNNITTSSTEHTQIEQVLSLCGACENPLHLPPPPSPRSSKHSPSSCGGKEDKRDRTFEKPKTTHQTGDHRIITCANYSRKQGSGQQSSTKCRSMAALALDPSSTSTALMSPHFHFCCAGIPENSSLYAKMKEGLERKELKKQRQLAKKQSNDRSTTPSPVPTTLTQTQTVVSEFLCPACDIKGTSMYLYEYFTVVHEMKVQYYNDEDSMYSIQPVGNPWLQHNQAISRSNDDSNLVKIDTAKNMRVDNGFVSFLLEREIQKHIEEKESMIHSTKGKTRYKNTEVRLDHIENILRRIPSSGANLKHINPTFFVGQPFRLFCNITNCYYTGRIVDSKVVELKDIKRLKDTTKSNYEKGLLFQGGKGQQHTKGSKQRILLDQDVGRTMYLVRFRAGIEGRKVAVHEWIFLEEHPLIIAISLVWANTDNFQGNGRKREKRRRIEHRVGYTNRNDTEISSFRPAQLFVRTALEMTMWDEINQFSDYNGEGDFVNTLGIFFSQKFISTVLRLSTIDSSFQEEHCNKASSILMNKDSANVSIVGINEEKKDIDNVAKPYSSEIIKSLFVADFNNPPVILQFHLGEGKSTNDILNISVSLATMEAKEQDRVKQYTSSSGHH